MRNLIFVAGQKGGTTKSTTSHLICLGAFLRKQPSVYVLTDPNRSLKDAGRPYAVMDGRDAEGLAQIIKHSEAMKNGWVVVDGGGNRPAFDKAVAEIVDLAVLPFRPSEEDIETVAKDLEALPGSIALPSAWSTNKHAQAASQWLIDGLDKAYPGRVVREPLWFVNSAAELLGASLENPSGPVRIAARRAFSVITEAFKLHAQQAESA
ncbi:hypothetical protein [Paraburkholderia susongensis]|uniref:Chromosome partitioning protein n=1 Tax=Paraburkholderia susongensis TaxID=1515439 RepID=A0A1X7M7S4_9BURK|nr:hypothetical protein [Paraburkholderia susongensis]SMG61583.1 hypothetical protein SAMN06265784_12341 [Paraburkholderia susongensis]